MTTTAAGDGTTTAPPPPRRPKATTTTAMPPPHSPKLGSVLALLAARELRGVAVVGRPNNDATGGESGESTAADFPRRSGRGSAGLMRHRAPHRRGRDVTVDDLSAAVAWNVRRLQNTILAVGPGTPATAVLGHMASSSSDEDDDEEDEADAMHEARLLDTDDEDEDGDEAEDAEADADADAEMGEGNDNEAEGSGDDSDAGEAEEDGREDRRGARRQRWRRVAVAQADSAPAASSSGDPERGREELFGGEESRVRRREMVEETCRAMAAALREGGGAGAEVAEVLAAGSAALRREAEAEEEDDDDDNESDGDNKSSSSDSEEEEQSENDAERDNDNDDDDMSAAADGAVTSHDMDAELEELLDEREKEAADEAAREEDDRDAAKGRAGEECEEEPASAEAAASAAVAAASETETEGAAAPPPAAPAASFPSAGRPSSGRAAARLSPHDASSDDSDSASDRRRRLGRSSAPSRHPPNNGTRRLLAPSMRHGGCINTATWLDCPWRLSLVSQSGGMNAFVQSSSHSSNYSGNAEFARDVEEEETEDVWRPVPVPTAECPTQLLTSGDDRLVKFWDVSSAMGSTGPLPGTAATSTPFSSPVPTSPDETVVNTWKSKYRRGYEPPGAVMPLATLRTGHRGNVFHVLPVPSRPGKVLTCAADGFLRMPDVEAHSVPSSGATSVGRSGASSFRRGTAAADLAPAVISPEYDGDDDDDALLPPGLLSLRAGMCFSHHLLDADSGLLCSERGLRRFDLRVSAREQPRGSVLGESDSMGTCKSCAVWNASGSAVGGGGGVDSAYVFAGGSSGDVALYDLRMTGVGSGSRIVQRYRPRAFGPRESVSVSGLDVSRDGRELLVSYENDQIYTFPIFPHASSPAGPTVEDMAISVGVPDEDDGEGDGEDGVMRGGPRRRVPKRRLMPELGTYGGHLNRYTFLKMAKYAGPNDEYICTGSDSGHAWIYERQTGTVAALLRADNSTCNGVVPHPTLPIFCTYGIDSTAKLWRATGPVDGEVDDSNRGRARSAHTAPYSKSLVVRSWKTVSTKLDALADCFDDDRDSDDDDGDDDKDHDDGDDDAKDQQQQSFLPDEVPARDDDLDDAVFGGLAGVLFRSGIHNDSGGPFIGNDLRNLPRVLTQNYYACVRSGKTGEDSPVRSGLEGFKRRVGVARVAHQASRRGLVQGDDPRAPWALSRPRQHGSGRGGSGGTKRDGSAAVKKEAGESEAAAVANYDHPADLVPEYPSDWMPFDPSMVTGEPQEGGVLFNDADYSNYLCERYGPQEKGRAMAKVASGNSVNAEPSSGSNLNGVKDTVNAVNERGSDVDKQARDDEEMHDTEGKHRNGDTEGGVSTGGAKPEHTTSAAAKTSKAKSARIAHGACSWDILHRTIQTLKEGGNEALRANNASLAASRYDCALRYCSVAFMDFPVGGLDFLCSQQVQLLRNGGQAVKWTPVLKLMITVRLNLSMAMLRPAIADTKGASEQACLALNELKPFVAFRGKVMMGKKLNRARDDLGGGEEEPPQTYQEAKGLQAKAYFRLGSAQHASGDFGAAAKSLERSVEARKEAEPEAEPDALVARRLAEARWEARKKKKRQRKKFKFMFAQDDEKEDDNDEQEWGGNT